MESKSNQESNTGVSVQDSSMERREGMHLHFINCIVLNDKKSDALIFVSCIALRLDAKHSTVVFLNYKCHFSK